MCSSFSCCLWLSCRLFVGEPLWHPGPRLAVAGRRQDSAWAVGGQAAYSLCSVAILYQQPKRLLHVPHPCHCPKLWGLLCLPAATYAGMHGLLCSRYVCSEQKWIDPEYMDYFTFDKVCFVCDRDGRQCSSDLWPWWSEQRWNMSTWAACCWFYGSTLSPHVRSNAKTVRRSGSCHAVRNALPAPLLLFLMNLACVPLCLLEPGFPDNSSQPDRSWITTKEKVKKHMKYCLII